MNSAFAPSRGEQVVSALERSDRRFRALIENSLDAVLMIDARGRVQYASPRVFGREGLLRGLGPEFRAWFRRDFHPSQIDDGPLIAEWHGRVAIGS